MKTFDVKHSDIVNFENILEADKNASQCKHYRDENLKFSAHREEGIIDLLNRLTYYPVFDEEGNQIPGKTESSYKVGRYRKKTDLRTEAANYYGAGISGSRCSMGLLPDLKPVIR